MKRWAIIKSGGIWFFLFASSIAAQDRTFELQTLLNGPLTVIDLKGQTWPIRRLTLTVEHSGKTIRNGVIQYAGSDGAPQYQLVEIVQGRTWNGKSYRAGKIDFRLEKVTLDGTFAYDSGLQEHNEKVAAQRGKDFSLIGPVTNRAGDIVLDQCQFIHSGRSGWAGPCESLTVTDCKAYQVAKHVFALPGWGGMQVKIDGLTTINCGNAFDLSNPDKEMSNALTPDVAEIRNVASFDNRGRTKLASPNWVAEFSDIRFQQKDVVSLNTWPAIDGTYNAHRVRIDGFEAVNFIVGIGTLSDSERNDGPIEIQNATFRDCFIPIKAQQRIHLKNARMVGHFQKYQSGEPIEQDVSADDPQSAQHWADVFDAIEELYAAKNAEWGTNYKPNYWVPQAVRERMEHR